MDERISRLNKVQISSKKPIVDNEVAHFEWEDKGLLSLLVDGQPRLNPRRVSDQNLRSEEEAAVQIANNIIHAYTLEHDFDKLEAAFNEAIVSADGYMEERLREIKLQVIRTSLISKGLCIYGEGGIGKTRFLYDLCLALEAKGRPFAACFNQGAFAELRKIGLQTFRNLFQDGCTLIIDGCNELEGNDFDLAMELIGEATKAPKSNIVVSTRSESPTSHLCELQAIVPYSIEFEGVNPYRVYDALSECSDELIIQSWPLTCCITPDRCPHGGLTSR